MFKLIGPVSHTHSHGTHGEQTRLATHRHIIVWLPQVLVKQELMEVRNNVQKRVEFIKSDIKRLEGNCQKLREADGYGQGQYRCFAKEQQTVGSQIRAGAAESARSVNAADVALAGSWERETNSDVHIRYGYSAEKIGLAQDHHAAVQGTLRPAA